MGCLDNTFSQKGDWHNRFAALPCNAPEVKEKFLGSPIYSKVLCQKLNEIYNTDLRVGLQVSLVPRPATYYPPRGRPAAAPQEAAVSTPRPPPGAPGPLSKYLAEIKICGAGPTWYPCGSVEKAMDRRARALPEDYKKKVADINQEYHGTVRGQVGPLQALLEELCGGNLKDLLGLCVGAFGDISCDLDRLIRALSESRALFQDREAGRPLSDREAGFILGQYRRVLSVTFVRSNAACLVARMGHLGEAARQCTGGGGWPWQRE